MRELILLVALVAIIPIGSANGGSFEDQFHEHMLEVGWKQSLMDLDRCLGRPQKQMVDSGASE